MNKHWKLRMKLYQEDIIGVVEEEEEEDEAELDLTNP
jgi:hypothetical protein